MKILAPSFRHFAKQAYRGTGYEAQDVLAEVADLHLLSLQATSSFAVREPLLRLLAWHDLTGLAIQANPGLHSTSLSTDYDLLVLYCQHRHLPELHYLNAINNWSKRCRRSICVLDELWACEVYRLRKHLKRLRQFDLIIVGFEGSVQPASDIIEKPCYFIPAAVDTLRFSSRLRPQARCIDVYSMGRRQETLHRALCQLAERNHLFYFFDTTVGGDAVCPDYRQHRDMQANLIRRSRCFMVAPALVDKLAHLDHQIEVPNRYFEGAAAGAILLGQRPACKSFDRLFDWPDAVVDVRADGSDCEGVLLDLLNDPVRCEQISRRNSVEALLKHDWVYRWMDILKLLGMEPTDAMLAREQRLREIATLSDIISFHPSNH